MRLALFLVPLAVAASCGGVISSNTTDGGGTDAATGGPCATSADCPNGGDCAYPVNAGCSAQKQCFPPKKACKSMPYCACDGTTTSDDCNGGASKPVAHTGPCEDSGDCATGLACEVCDVTGFSVSPQVTPNDATKACTAQDITSFVAACLSASATQATCSAWQQGDAGTSACGACVLTPMSAAKWGPIVCQANSCTINSGGCIDIVSGQVVIENGTNGSCGDLTNAADQCVGYACAGCTSPSDSDTCAKASEQAECKSYFDAEQTASVCGLVDAGATTCSPQSDADWASFINVFCGTGP